MRGYADHMETEQFRHTMRDIIELAAHDMTVLMCAERLPEHCHRNLVADYLLAQGCRVIHLIAVGMAREHRLSPLVREIDGRLIYNRDMTLPLDLR